MISNRIVRIELRTHETNAPVRFTIIFDMGKLG